MTWLPVRTGHGSERDAVLGLKQEPYDAMRRVLTAAWRSTDPRLLELCRLRLAQLTEARAELVAGESTLAEVEGWPSSARLTERERAALAFAEQYHYDHQLLDTGPRVGLERHLSERELVNFVWALQMNDAYIRVLSLLDIAPDPATAAPRAERIPPPNPPREARRGRSAATGGSLMDPAFATAYSQLNRIVVRQSLVDEMTSEVVRLRNASHQSCHY